MDYSEALSVHKPQGKRNTFIERVDEDEIQGISLACRGGEGHSKQKGPQCQQTPNVWLEQSWSEEQNDPIGLYSVT